MTLDEFLSRWAPAGASERANKDTFLVELCDVLGVERPAPRTGDRARDVLMPDGPGPVWVDLPASESSAWARRRQAAVGVLRARLRSVLPAVGPAFGRPASASRVGPRGKPASRG